MKTILLAIMILSTQAHAAFQCDINTDTVPTTEVSVEKVIKSVSHTSTYNAQGISQDKAVQECIKTGANNCQLSGATVCKYNNNGAWLTGGFLTRDTYTCKSVAVGTKTAYGKTLSSVEIAETKRLQICNKLENCRNQVLNDHDAVTTDFDKIDYLANKYKCE